MPSIKLDADHGFSVRFSPVFPRLLACASAQNQGLNGAGSLLILENTGKDHLLLRKRSNWPNGVLDVSWPAYNENIILSSSCDGSIQLWKVYTKSCVPPIKVFNEHTLDVSSLDTNHNSVASGSWDSTIKLWDLNGTSSLSTLKEVSGLVHSVKWSKAFPNLLLSVSDAYHFTLWDRSVPRPSLHTVKSQDSEALDCDWSYRNPYEMAVSGSDGAIRVWDIRQLERPVIIMSQGTRAISRIRWSPHYHHIIAHACYDLGIGIWNCQTGELLENVRHHSGFIFGLDFNRNVPGQLADCGLDSLIHVFTPWSLHSSKKSIIFKNKL